ncbi:MULTISPECIES: peptidoglycan recognition family protein [Streptomyces]|uniref:peptidoglycan recognition protein family protein n=1 Tax=Streptomyces TaxID=1883 RepID=UPI00099DEBB2|nr:peptidoglycan recognition family protein [Streptomyces virginiae]
MTSPSSPRFSRRALVSAAFTLGATVLYAPAASATSSRDTPRSLSGSTLPEIFDCTSWGARAASDSVVVLAARPTRIIVHHAVTTNSSDYSRNRAHQLARAIQSNHMDLKGWIDTGQHFTISRGGFVLEGRHRSLAALNSGNQLVRAAHCVGQNNIALGIETEGTYMTHEPPERQFSALADLCAHACHQYGIAASDIYGHRDFVRTACPGNALYAMLSKLRNDVAARLDGKTPGAAVPRSSRQGNPAIRARHHWTHPDTTRKIWMNEKFDPYRVL